MNPRDIAGECTKKKIYIYIYICKCNRKHDSLTDQHTEWLDWLSELLSNLGVSPRPSCKWITDGLIWIVDWLVEKEMGRKNDILIDWLMEWLITWVVDVKTGWLTFISPCYASNRPNIWFTGWMVITLIGNLKVWHWHNKTILKKCKWIGWNTEELL